MVRGAPAHYDLADQDDTSADVLEFLAQSPSADVLARVARHPNTNESTLTKLAALGSDRVSCSVANNPRTPVRCLSHLAATASTGVLLCLIKNPSLPPADVERLAVHEDDAARTSAAGHANLSVRTLGVLAGDDSRRVRLAVVRQERLPLSRLVEVMADESDEWVITEGLCHGRLPGEVLAGYAHLLTTNQGFNEMSCGEWAQRHLSVASANREAIAVIARGDWWMLTPTSPEVLLALAVLPGL